MRSRGCGTIVAAAIAALAVLSPTAGAQRIRGVVVDSTLRARIPGAVVSVLDASGRVVGRTIANAAGEFSVARPSNSASVHVVRIGFRPRDLPVPADNASVEIRMMRIPVMLERMLVSSKELCPGSADRGPAFQLWEQARAGLLAAVVAREARPATVTTVGFVREMPPRDEYVAHQVARTIRSTAKRPFASASRPATFAQRGYLVENGAGRIYDVPDADVLLDASFMGTHCFRLQASDAAHPDQIGLAFAPLSDRARDTLVDVAGVLWLDRAVPALRSLDFNYTGLEPAAVRVRSGGHLEFRNMSNGVSFIERWSLRLADLAVAPGRDPLLRSRRNRSSLTVSRIEEQGGEVVSASWADGTTWAAEPTGINGTVVQSGDSAPPVPFALIVPANGMDTVQAKATGAFSIVPMVPGRYRVTVIDTTLHDVLEPRSASQTVEVQRGRVASLRLELPRVQTALRRLCDDASSGERTTVFIGRVLLPTTVDASDAVLLGDWQEFGASVSDLSPRTLRQSSHLDDAGRFTVCGVPQDRLVRLRLTFGSATADTTVRAAAAPWTIIRWRPAISTSPAPARPAGHSQSSRNAATGSSRAARRAGSAAAATPTTASAPAEASRVNGSVGVTP